MITHPCSWGAVASRNSMVGGYNGEGSQKRDRKGAGSQYLLQDLAPVTFQKAPSPEGASASE